MEPKLKRWQQEARNIVRRIWENDFYNLNNYFILKNHLNDFSEWDSKLKQILQKEEKNAPDRLHYVGLDIDKTISVFLDNNLILSLEKYEHAVLPPIPAMGYKAIPNLESIDKLQGDITPLFNQDRQIELKPFFEGKLFRILIDGSFQINVQEDWITFCKLNLGLKNMKVTSCAAQVLLKIIKKKEAFPNIVEFSIESINAEEDMENYKYDQIYNAVGTIKDQIPQDIKEQTSPIVIRRKFKRIQFPNIIQNHQEIEAIRREKLLSS